MIKYYLIVATTMTILLGSNLLATFAQSELQNPYVHPACPPWDPYNPFCDPMDCVPWDPQCPGPYYGTMPILPSSPIEDFAPLGGDLFPPTTPLPSVYIVKPIPYPYPQPYPSPQPYQPFITASPVSASIEANLTVDIKNNQSEIIKTIKASSTGDLKIKIVKAYEETDDITLKDLLFKLYQESDRLAGYMQAFRIANNNPWLPDSASLTVSGSSAGGGTVGASGTLTWQL